MEFLGDDPLQDSVRVRQVERELRHAASPFHNSGNEACARVIKQEPRMASSIAISSVWSALPQ